MPLLFPVLMLAAACAPEQQPVEIVFDLRYAGQTLTCADSGAPIRLTDARFYIHDVHLVAEDGRMLPVEFIPDDAWQDRQVALIDLEDGAGACLNGSKETNHSILGRYSGGPVRGIEFRIGVPAELNHKDPLQAGAPLGYSAMHWHWASGYKFMRIGVETANDGYFLHLGSSRCQGTIGDIDSCKSANRPLVRLPDFLPEFDSVVLALDELLHQTDLANGAASNCMSGPADAECRGPFSSMGLDFASGAASGIAPAFRSANR